MIYDGSFLKDKYFNGKNESDMIKSWSSNNHIVTRGDINNQVFVLNFSSLIQLFKGCLRCDTTFHLCLFFKEFNLHAFEGF